MNLDKGKQSMSISNEKVTPKRNVQAKRIPIHNESLRDVEKL